MASICAVVVKHEETTALMIGNARSHGYYFGRHST